MIYRAYAIEMGTTPVARYWTGRGTITFEGESWAGGGEAIGVSGMQLLTGSPDLRTTISLSGVDATLRGNFLQDEGPFDVTVYYIKSTDLRTWSRAPALFKGRVSRAPYEDGTFTFELETRKGDVERGRPRRVSREDQRRRFPGDKGLDYMPQLSQVGYDTTFPS